MEWSHPRADRAGFEASSAFQKRGRHETCPSTSRRLTSRSATAAAHKVDEIHWNGWLLIAAPRHVLVGTHEHELARIQVPGIGRVDLEDSERNASLRRRFDKSRVGVMERQTRRERFSSAAPLSGPLKRRG
jgi:hypothetical protein